MYTSMYGREKESGGVCVCVCAQRVRERTWSSARLHLMLAGYAAPPKNFVENFVVRKGERERERAREGTCHSQQHYIYTIGFNVMQ